MTPSPLSAPCYIAFSIALLTAGSARAEKTCYDELGHKIPGACEEKKAPPPSGSASGADRAFDDGSGHSGFFLRMTLGGGPARYTTDDATIGKVAGNFDIAIGGAPFDNFAIYGLLLGSSINKPTYEVGAFERRGEDGEAFNTSVLALGATYYLPWNLYLDAAIGTAIMTFTYPDIPDESTKAGLGVVVGVGKEWMVSESWGLGAALKVVGTRAQYEDENVTLDFSGFNATLAFSATFF